MQITCLGKPQGPWKTHPNLGNTRCFLAESERPLAVQPAAPLQACGTCQPHGTAAAGVPLRSSLCCSRGQPLPDLLACGFPVVRLVNPALLSLCSGEFSYFLRQASGVAIIVTAQSTPCVSRGVPGMRRGRYGETCVLQALTLHL